MAAIFTYTSDRVICPNPACHKPFVGRLPPEFPLRGTTTCGHCRRRFTVEIATYKTTSEEVR